mgnify:CR=1
MNRPVPGLSRIIGLDRAAKENFNPQFFPARQENHTLTGSETVTCPDIEMETCKTGDHIALFVRMHLEINNLCKTAC